MNSIETNFSHSSCKGKIDKNLVISKLRDSVTLCNPYTGLLSVFERQRVILSILRKLQNKFPHHVSSYLGGSSILNDFGGPVYHSVADLDWTVIITSSANPSETFIQAQACVIHSLATLLFPKKDVKKNLILPECIGVRVTTPLLPDGFPFARYCFTGCNVPLELSLHVRNRPLSRLMYDLFIPLSPFRDGLGSGSPNEFELHSSDCTEEIDINTVLSNIRARVIIYNPEPHPLSYDRNKWLRLLIAITEGSLAPDSDINRTWFEEAVRGDICPSHVIAWAYYKRPGIKHYPFFLSLNAFFSTEDEHSLAKTLLVETIYSGRFLQGHPLFSWVRSLVDIFELEGPQHFEKISSIHPHLKTLFKLFIPYFADEAVPCKHSHLLHLHSRFGNESPFFAPIPITGEDKLEFYSRQDLRPLIREENFVGVIERMLESPLIIPDEVDALFLLAERLPPRPFSFNAHIRAALHWKVRKIELFLLHLVRALDCSEQDLFSCRDRLLQENNPFLFETTVSLLQLPQALLLSSHQLNLFGPDLPLSFFSSCVKKGITDPIIEHCLQALEVAPPEMAWKAYRDLTSVPELAKAIERKHLPSMLSLAISEPDKESYYTIVLRRMAEAPPKRAFELARLAEALSEKTFNPLPYAIQFLKTFPTKKGLILESFPDLEEQISQEETRLLLLDKKLNGAELIEALPLFNPASCSVEELSSLAADTVSKFTQQPFTEFLKNYQILLSFLRSLPEEEQEKFLPRWLDPIFNQYKSFVHEFSDRFWEEVVNISSGRIENTKPWKKLFITLVFLLPPQRESLPFIISLEQATHSISDREFPFILPQGNLEKRWLYHFKAACLLRGGAPSAALTYLESMLALPYQEKNQLLLTSFGKDPFNFHSSFEKLSQGKKVLHLLAYQRVIAGLSELLPFYVAAYKKFPQESEIVAACSSATIQAIEANPSELAWKIYPDLYEIPLVAEKIESLDLTKVAETEQNKALYAEIIRKRFPLAQEQVKRHILELFALLGGEDRIDTLLAEEFRQTLKLIDGAERWYSRFSSRIASQITGVALHHFVLHFPEGNRSLGWELFLEAPLACPLEESRFYLESATLEEKCTLLSKLLDLPKTPNPQKKGLFDLIVPTDSDLEALLSFERWTSESLLSIFSFLAPRDKKSRSFISFINFSLTYTPSYLQFKDLLERIFPLYDEEAVKSLSDRYSAELKKDLKENNNLEKHLLFLIRHKVGKALSKRKTVYPLLLDLSAATSFQYTEELLKVLKAPLSPDLTSSFYEILAFKQVMCVWKIYESSARRPIETLCWLADKIALSLSDLNYLNLYNIITEEIPQFHDMFLDRRIPLLNGREERENNLIAFCSLLPHIRLKDLDACIKYCTKMYSRFPNSNALICAEKLYYLSITKRQNKAAVFIIKNIILKHAKNAGIHPSNAHFYLLFFIHDLDNPIDFLWGYTEIAALFLEASTQYLLSGRNEIFTLRAILQKLENKNPEQAMLADEWLVAERCIELLSGGKKIDLNRSLKTIGKRNSPIGEKIEREMFQLYPQSAAVLLAYLTHFSLSPETHPRLRELCAYLSDAPISAEGLFLLQNVIPQLNSYFSSKRNELNEVDTTTQKCLQAISFIAFKCNMEAEGREAAALLYSTLSCLNHSHMDFLVNNNFHRFLFKDTSLYYSFLECADKSFEDIDQTLKEQISIFLINSQYVPIHNRQKLEETDLLYFKVISKYSSSTSALLPIELQRKERIQAPITTIALKELKAQSKALTEPFSHSETFFEKLSINLACVRSHFSELSGEHAFFVRDLIPSLTAFVLQKSRQHPGSENLVLCSQQLIKFSVYFSEPELIRELGVQIHEKRLIDALEGRDNPLFAIDLEMYTILLGTFFTPSLYGPSAACAHTPPPSPILWVELLKRGKDQELYGLISRTFLFCANTFIQPGVQDPHLLFYATFTTKLLVGATEERLPLPNRTSISPQLLERLLFFTYCHDSQANFDCLMTSCLMLSTDETFLFQAIQEGAKRQGENRGYCFKMSNLGLKFLLSNPSLLSSVEESEPEIKMELLHIAFECPWENYEAGPFLKLFIEMMSKTPSINSDLPFQILEKAVAILENISEFNTRTLGSISFFTHLLFPFCEEYSDNHSPLKVPKEILLRSILPLIKFDAPSLLYLVFFLDQSKKISKSGKEFVEDMIAKLDHYLETPDFFPDESEAIRLTTLPKAIEVREQLQLYAIYLQ